MIEDHTLIKGSGLRSGDVVRLYLPFGGERGIYTVDTIARRPDGLLDVDFCESGAPGVSIRPWADVELIYRSREGRTP